jgi:hypothetical protein
LLVFLVDAPVNARNAVIEHQKYRSSPKERENLIFFAA